MADSTLLLGYNDFVSEVAHYLGYQYAVPTNAARLAECDRLVNRGVHNVYHPQHVTEIYHEWSWISPKQTMTWWKDVVSESTRTATQSGTTVTANIATFGPEMIGATINYDTSTDVVITAYTSSTVVTVDTSQTVGVAEQFAITLDGKYRMPDNYFGIDGTFTYTDQSLWTEAVVGSENEVRNLRERVSTTGRPELVAIRALTNDLTEGQRFELITYPEPDADYTVAYTGKLLVDKISTSAPYPLGGAAFSQLYLEACLAEAEMFRHREEGPQYSRFMRRLVAAINHDKEANTADTFGYMGNKKFSSTHHGGIYHSRDQAVRYTGGS